MTGHRKYIRFLAALAGAAGLSGLVVYFASPGQEKKPILTGEAGVIQSAMARIAAESRGVLYEPPIQAAPRSEETLPLAERSVEDTVPSPPDGYSFVSYYGEMPRARVTGETDAGDDPERPDPDWLDPPTSIESLVAQASAAGRDWTFGWVQIAGGAKAIDVAGLIAEFGATVLGSSGNLVRAQLPGDPALLQEIAGLPEVDGLGTVPPEMKLPEALTREASEAPSREQTPVFITLMTDDPDGRWRQALEDRGAVVGRFDPDVRTYTANVAYGEMETIAAADFVLAIEPVGIVRAAHDTAVPAMGVDALRVYNGSPGIFSGVGGASVPIGVMDTGLNINHLDIASNRESICGANFAWDSLLGPDGQFGEAEDLWIDEGGHGTHVTGTMAGNGSAKPRFAGMAPSVRHIRFAKVLDSFGSGIGDGVARGMDFLAEATECSELGRPSNPVKPLIVNMSLSGSSRRFEGRGVGARKLDSIVWGFHQLYVVVQANSDISGFSDFGTAKNSLAVGAVQDSGDIAVFSSHGPTFDGRLAPQVVATGVRVHSAQGGGSRGQYVALNGTSMSSPTVAGVAALLLDAVPEHQEQPALARARLMASSIRPDPWLDVPDAFPSTNTGGPGSLQAEYGLGKVSARTGILNRDDAGGWISGGAVSELQQREFSHQDIEVPEGASRLDLVMTWDEPPADAIASTVLNDLDLWLDRDGDCGDGPCGEHFSTSRVDNVEWIILRNPRPGTYRAKVVARRVYTASPRAALAWTVIRGTSTPNLEIEADRTLLAGEGEQELTLTLTADEYVAAGSRLHVDCRDSADSSGCDQIRIHAADASREDGISVDLSNEIGQTQDEIDLGSPIALGSSIPLGEVAAAETQEIRFVVSSEAEGDPARLYFTASAWNAKGASVSVGVGRSGVSSSDMIQRPANDDFNSAAVIQREQGSQDVDLLLATPEPGEPLFTAPTGRPAGSVWYVWTAPADGAVRFELHPPVEFQDRRNDRVGVFRGDAIADLERVASNQWGTIFFAEEGETYRVRVSCLNRGTAVQLRWSQGNRPVNDDFDQASVLEGATGTVVGSGGGATLEPGEWFGTEAGTTWYRWTAPSDGRWRIYNANSSLRVFVFEGDSISALRLVSHVPSGRATFPAAAGTEYRIAVASRDADQPGGLFKLDWSPWSDPYPDRDKNDDIAGAEAIESTTSSQHVIRVDQQSTVEPGEPLESGVRTRWWTWNAPSHGRYTWRLEDRGETVPRYPKLQLTVFSGTSSDDLQFVARTGPDTVPSDIVFQATRGQRYWLAAGFPVGDIAAYQVFEASAKVIWGRTPGNDSLANAVSLEEASGSISRSNRFATTERGERGSVLGHSSLWWTYEASATGWIRFWLDDPDGPWVLAVYRRGGDGFGGLEFVRSSHPPEAVEPDGVEVVFHAQEGVRYTIRLGGRGRAGGGDFTMNWEETEPPIWLRYSERLADGDVDAEGTPVQLRGPLSLAVNDSGTALFVASRLGLQVFERDAESGSLTLVQLLEDEPLDDSSLLWDPRRSKLYAYRYGVWRRFAPVDNPEGHFQDQGTFSVTGASDQGYGPGEVFLDPGGSFLHVVDYDGGLHVLTLDTPNGLRHVETKRYHKLKRALISNGGTHVFAINESRLFIFERATDTGRLTFTLERFSGWQLYVEALAISTDDRYLFVFDDNGRRTNVFDLEDDPSRPSSLGTLTPFWHEPFWNWNNRCGLAAARKGIPAVDVFCKNMAYSVQWDPETGELAATDHAATWQADRYNNYVPEFGQTRDLATSPDGRYAYLDTEDQGLVVIERIGSGAEP